MPENVNWIDHESKMIDTTIEVVRQSKQNFTKN